MYEQLTIRLLCFINKYIILNENQFGFRRNYSTVEAVHHLSETNIQDDFFSLTLSGTQTLGNILVIN